MRRNRLIVALHLIAIGGGVVAGARLWAGFDFDATLFAALLGSSIAADMLAPPPRRATITVSGSFLALVLAMVFLGPAHAALMGVLTIVASSLRWRPPPRDVLGNVVAYLWFPLLSSLAFHFALDRTGANVSEPLFYFLVIGTFGVANVLNLAFLFGGEPAEELVRVWWRVVRPSLPSQVVSALLTIGIAFAYIQVGIAAVAGFALVLFSFQWLFGKLLVSEDRADELERRSEQLASLQVGLLSALLRTLDLRDRMTARHSAAVARYAREIAAASGMSDEEQELAHTAGLLHDIGKFTFPDHILKADQRLTDDDWKIIKTHPYQGAKIVAQVEGYGPVGDIIIGHHERYDGKGYPRGIAGEDIPPISRIISVADVYDVITARDSYRTPVSSFEAIQELRRVAGRQLDPHFVEVFVELLAGRDLSYRHGEDADFETELPLEKRVHAYAAPGAGGAFSGGEALAEDADGSGSPSGVVARARARIDSLGRGA